MNNYEARTRNMRNPTPLYILFPVAGESFQGGRSRKTDNMSFPEAPYRSTIEAPLLSAVAWTFERTIFSRNCDISRDRGDLPIAWENMPLFSPTVVPSFQRWNNVISPVHEWPLSPLFFPLSRWLSGIKIVFFFHLENFPGAWT